MITVFYNFLSKPFCLLSIFKLPNFLKLVRYSNIADLLKNLKLRLRINIDDFYIVLITVLFKTHIYLEATEIFTKLCLVLHKRNQNYYRTQSFPIRKLFVREIGAV